MVSEADTSPQEPDPPNPPAQELRDCHPPILLYYELVMKTTLDLSEDLLAEAKAVAARRRTTLRAMVEHALRREIMPLSQPVAASPFELNDLGMLVLKKHGEGITLETIRALQDETDREDMERTLNPGLE